MSVTGHRDLVKEEVPEIKMLVRKFFEKLISDYPSYQVTILNPLAEGADQLVANVVSELDVDLIVPLPKPLDDYRKDFQRAESLSHFEELLGNANSVFELVLLEDVLGGEVLETTSHSGLPYARLGVFLSAHCHILLALWDGKQSNELGGTSQVVQFHHDDYIPDVTKKTIASRQMLVDDESDLIYHVVCSRDRENGTPQNGLKPLETCWFTKDIYQPRSEDIPEQHKNIFQRGSEFSDDAKKYIADLGIDKASLLQNAKQKDLPSGIQSVDNLFTIADGLAIKFKKKTTQALALAHFFAFMMGLMFLLYSDLEKSSVYMVLFVVFFIGAALIHYYAKANGWERKYLDYRTLAEGLRVQLYWAAAGVSNESKWKFAHDSFLQSQDPEFGWIRNVMRVAGTRCAANPSFNEEGLKFALSEWVGDGNKGQLGYYKKVAEERFKGDRLTVFLDRFSVVISSGIVFLFLFFSSSLSGNMMTLLFLIMGIALLLYAIRESFASATAVKELVKQYEFMLRIFSNAHRRINETNDSEEKRQILLALGQSALEEHSDWILMHREKSLDQGEIFRMSS